MKRSKSHDNVTTTKTDKPELPRSKSLSLPRDGRQPAAARTVSPSPCTIGSTSDATDASSGSSASVDNGYSGQQCGLDILEQLLKPTIANGAVSFPQKNGLFFRLEKAENNDFEAITHEINAYFDSRSSSNEIDENITAAEKTLRGEIYAKIFAIKESREQPIETKQNTDNGGKKIETFDQWAARKVSFLKQLPTNAIDALMMGEPETFLAENSDSEKILNRLFLEIHHNLRKKRANKLDELSNLINDGQFDHLFGEPNPVVDSVQMQFIQQALLTAKSQLAPTKIRSITTQAWEEDEDDDSEQVAAVESPYHTTVKPSRSLASWLKHLGKGAPTQAFNEPEFFDDALKSFNDALDSIILNIADRNITKKFSIATAWFNALQSCTSLNNLGKVVDTIHDSRYRIIFGGGKGVMPLLQPNDIKKLEQHQRRVAVALINKEHSLDQVPSGVLQQKDDEGEFDHWAAIKLIRLLTEADNDFAIYLVSVLEDRSFNKPLRSLRATRDIFWKAILTIRDEALQEKKGLSEPIVTSSKSSGGGSKEDPSSEEGASTPDRISAIQEAAASAIQTTQGLKV